MLNALDNYRRVPQNDLEAVEPNKLFLPVFDRFRGRLFIVRKFRKLKGPKISRQEDF